MPENYLENEISFRYLPDQCNFYNFVIIIYNNIYYLFIFLLP